MRKRPAGPTQAQCLVVGERPEVSGRHRPVHEVGRSQRGSTRGVVLVVIGVMAALSATVVVVLRQNDDGDNARDVTTTTTERPPAPTTQPPATDPQAVLPIIKGLLERYTEVHAEIITDPRPVAADPDHRLRKALRALFTPNSVILKTNLDALEDPDENRHGYRPGPSGHVGLDLRITKVEPAPDADTFVVEVCAFFDSEEYDLDTGEVVSDPQTQVSIWFGPGEARRVDGRWRLVEFGPYSPDTQTDAPRGNRNTCPPEVAT